MINEINIKGLLKKMKKTIESFKNPIELAEL